MGLARDKHPEERRVRAREFWMRERLYYVYAAGGRVTGRNETKSKSKPSQCLSLCDIDSARWLLSCGLPAFPHPVVLENRAHFVLRPFGFVLVAASEAAEAANC